MLFLTDGPELEEERGGKVRVKTVVSPEGRYKVTYGNLEPVSGKKFAKELRGKPVKELRDKVARGKGGS